MWGPTLRSASTAPILPFSQPRYSAVPPFLSLASTSTRAPPHRSSLRTCPHAPIHHTRLHEAFACLTYAPSCSRGKIHPPSPLPRPIGSFE